ncbi:hypothetical protein AURDEDRAFT_161756 [Auricularia subglabra TFB-10046 SS5]|nr:hypothetical protein AURDEDRAFT_161756 [Auricularia subglabra TFB-10046 SS5]
MAPPLPPMLPAPSLPAPSNNYAPPEVRRNTISGVEPMRIDTARTVPVLFLGSANFGNCMTCSPVSMMDERMESPVRAAQGAQQQIESIAADIAEVRQAVETYGDRSIALDPVAREELRDTNERVYEVNGRVVDLAAVAQSVATQVGAIYTLHEGTVNAVNNVAAHVNRIAVGIHGEHGNPDTGILRVVDRWAVAMNSVKTQIEQTVATTDQALRQVDERLKRIEDMLAGRFGPRQVGQVRAQSASVPAVAVVDQRVSNRGSGSGTPAPPYRTIDPANPMAFN